MFAFLVLTAFQKEVPNDPLAVELIKKTTASYKKNKVYKIQFTRTNTSVAGKVLGKEKGEITVSGAQYRLVMPDQQVICDGKTMWAYNKDSKEVNVYDYDEADDDLAPNKVFDFYKEGCKVAYLGDVKSGKQVLSSIDINSNDRKSNITKYRLVIEKKTNTLKRWILFEKGSNTQIAFTLDKYLTNPVIKDGYFSYSKTDFPNAKLIDLR